MIGVRVALASTPQDRFVARIEAIRARIDQLPDAAVRAALEELEGIRRRVLAELATHAEGLDAYRLRQLTERLAGVMDEFSERYQVALAPYQADAAALGRSLVAEPLVHSGLTFGVPEIPRRLVEATVDFQADLIQGLTDDARRKITQAIRLGAIEGKSPFEIMRAVAGSLEGPGAFASIAARAEAITRTEIKRVQAVAGQATLEASKRLVPDLQKQWKHSGAINGRVTHRLYDGTVREVEDFYEVAPRPSAPREQLLYPRDPRGSAANTVQCGCDSLPYKADWPA
jgi:hypothetical protein